MYKHLLLPLLLTALLLCSCTLVALQGSGNVITETREASDFEQVAVCCGMRLVLTQGDEERLTIEADDNILPEIETYVSGDTLIIRYRSTTGIPSPRPSRPVVVNLQMITINGIDVSGGGFLESEAIETGDISLNFSGGSQGEMVELEADSVDLVASGGGQVTIDLLNADTLTIAASGGGRVTISGGTVNEQEATVSGGSRYLAHFLKSEITTLEASGGSEAKVWATDVLDVLASGGSDVEYAGEPEIDQALSGGSELRKVEPE